MTDKPEIIPQTEMLIQLAHAVRPRWDEDDIRAAIAGAQAIGRSWSYVLAAMQVLMNDPKARPKDLSPLAVRRATNTTRDVDPERAHRHAELIREQWPNLAARKESGK
ncbi:hypothetical protein [Nonomuraea sp. LPB2021202275-12-8]|uniref:hypothetical protein n=1 Tax=Nonomuraea sp. LPB2021202275-12-8 TaxID=3120159 RepID=UPI00300CF535